MQKEFKEVYYGFRSFRLKPTERVLECKGVDVRLHKQWYDVLLILVRCKGRVVQAEELIEAIWPGQAARRIGRTANLHVNIAELRKALGKVDPEGSRFIKNHSGEGYSFTALVVEHEVPRTIVILPFRSEDEQDVPDESAQKMADMLTTMLNKNMSINVRRLDSVIRECNQHPKQSPLIFGYRLEADYVFSGRIWRKQQLISVDFLDVRADDVKASMPFEGCHPESSDSIKVIYAWMESVLELTPVDHETKQSAKQYTTNEKAREYYENGRIKRLQSSKASLKRAINYFRRATTEDPDFARAYAGIADTYLFMGMLNLITPQESYEGAKGAAVVAREKGKDVAIAQTVWAFTKMFFEWQWLDAQEGFTRAIEINPKYSIAHMGYAQWLTAQGRHAEATAEINQAVSLDPYNFFISFVSGMILFLDKQYDQSLKQFERTHELNLRFNLKSDLPHYGLSLAYEYLALTSNASEREKLFAKSDDEARLAIRLSQNHPLKLMHRAQIKARCGNTDKALELLDKVFDLRRVGHYVSPYHLAIVYSSLEESESAIRSLQEAERIRDQYLFLSAADPRLDGLRFEPRFEELLSRIRLSN